MAAQTPSPAKPFTHATALQMLNQLRDGLVEHNVKKIAGAFDLASMSDGPQFKQQITAFLGQTENIRVHFNLVEVSEEAAKGLAVVDVEMEAGQRDDSLPPVYKQVRLRLVAENSATGWKFIDVQPRSFFSTAQP